MAKWFQDWDRSGSLCVPSHANQECQRADNATCSEVREAYENMNSVEKRIQGINARSSGDGSMDYSHALF
jgi:hypothetical protein